LAFAGVELLIHQKSATEARLNRPRNEFQFPFGYSIHAPMSAHTLGGFKCFEKEIPAG
jgi:hypothetical protein